MRKDFLHGAALLMLAASVVGLTACSSDDEAKTSTGKDHVLTISINLPKLAETRATNLVNNSLGNESNVNNLFISICQGTAGNVLTSTTDFTVSGSTITAKMTNAQMKAGDKVLVALNPPTGRFDDVTERSGFIGKTVTIDEALDAAGSKAVNVKNFPMFGEADLVADASKETNLKATVSPYRLVSKVIINSITADFTGDANYKDAVFEPTGYYILNSADKAYFNVTTTPGATDASWYDKDDKAYYQGWYTQQADYKEYLGSSQVASTEAVYISNQTGAKMPISDETFADGTITKATKDLIVKYEPKKVLYCMPNSQVDDAHATMLVILGKFYPKGTNSKVAYYVRYALNLNKNSKIKDDGTADNAAAEGNTTMNAVYPNREYKIDLTLKSIGDPTPGKFDPTDPATDNGGGNNPGTDTPPDPPKPVQNMTADITVTVASWVPVGQTVEY
jgi:hypothetical protein